MVNERQARELPMHDKEKGMKKLQLNRTRASNLQTYS